MTPKYFHYISKPKVEMLLAQIRRRPLALLSFSPKLEFAGISVGADLKSEPNKGLVTDTLRLLKTLKKQGAITAIEAEHELDSRNFYHSEEIWRHGLFYFATVTSFTVSYILWKTYNHSVVLLAGSPDNVIGQMSIREGLRISSTGDVMETLGSGSFLRAIEQDEPTRSTPYQRQADHRVFTEGFTDIDWLYMLHSKSKSAPMAMFCFKHLTRLTEMRIDTVFKVFSKLESVTANCLSDMALEYEKTRSELDEEDSKKPKWQRGAEYRKFVEEYWRARLSEAKALGLENYNTVCIGSPVYTALS